MTFILCDEDRIDELEEALWRIQHKIEGLEEDLKSAVEVAWDRGARTWVRVNYPARAARLEHIYREG